jgi:hypothetical protein
VYQTDFGWAETTCLQITASGGSAEVLNLDLADVGSIRSAVCSHEERRRGIDILINHVAVRPRTQSDPIPRIGP